MALKVQFFITFIIYSHVKFSYSLARNSTTQLTLRFIFGFETRMLESIFSMPNIIGTRNITLTKKESSMRSKLKQQSTFIGC